MKNHLYLFTHKRLFLFKILPVIAVAVIITLFSAREMASAASADQSAVTVKLSSPLSLSEIASVINQHGAKPTELHYIQGDIQGGYTINSGETIKTATQNFLNAHKAFLALSIAKADQDIRDTIDKVTRERLLVLRNQLNSAQIKTNKGDFKVDEFEVKDEQSLVSLKKSGYIKSVTPVQKVIKKPLEESVPDKIGPLSYSHEIWAPSRGSSSVQKTYTYQTFYFNNVSNFVSSTSTYEHETQVYNKSFADYAGYWSSNMPSPYYDTPFLDTIDNFTIGTFTASAFRTNTQYFTYMSLKAGSASTSTVRIKGQKGHRFPSWCYSTWCVFADATSGSMAVVTAPNITTWNY